MRSFVITTLLCLLPLLSIDAQKIGHVNFGNLLSAMPGTEQADKEMEALDASLRAEGQVMLDKLRADYAKAEADAPNLPPVEVQKIEAQLQQDQTKIQRFEQSINVKLEQKRRELLEPIVKIARAAIKQVAEANGYGIVLDSSIFNAVLFTAEGTDLTPLVKTELGIE